MSYLAFLGYFLLPPIFLVYIFVRRSHCLSPIKILGILIMAGIALVYTTPWDNYLIMRGVWYYPQGAVVGTLGYVPLEEYSFMVLQTILAGLVWSLFTRDLTFRVMRFSLLGVLFAGFLCVVGILCLLRDSGTYVGLILTWASLPLALQWGLGLRLLLQTAIKWILPWFLLTLYLCLADSYAISEGIWTLEPATRTGWELGNLPVEEALFFALTNLFVFQGLSLWQSWKGSNA